MTNKIQRRILVVDDDEGILKLIKKFLERNNFIVSTSSSSVEALKLVTYGNFDLIILDVMMPELTGIEFSKEIRSNADKIPIVILTALCSDKDRIEAIQGGANEFISKPFDPQELLSCINNLLN